MGHLERKQRERETLRQAMLDAALDIAEKEGWNALTVRKIADAIEYTAPIVYEYFGNKEELIGEIIQMGYRTMYEGFKGIFEKKLSPKDTLLELSMAHWDFAFQNKVLYQLMFSLERQKPADEVVKGMTSIKDAFVTLTQKDGEELFPIIFNWVCLMNGTISAILMMEGCSAHHRKEFHIEPREMYRSFIERFIGSLSKELNSSL